MIKTHNQTLQIQQQQQNPSTVSLATATAAGQRDLETRNQFLIDPDLGSRISTIPVQPQTQTQTSTQLPTINLNTPGEMRHERGNVTDHGHDRSPIPQSTLRNSMNVQRPHFVHTNTEFHTYHQSSSSSSLVLGQGHTPNNSNNVLPYRDHPLTKEEYPQQPQQQITYNPSFPPRQQSQSRRNVRSSTSGPTVGNVNIWDSTRCRLLDFKCRLCSREGAIGRGLMIGWVLTTLGFLLACAFWKGELFTGKLRFFSIIRS
jgi:hypothetical protein